MSCLNLETSFLVQSPLKLIGHLSEFALICLIKFRGIQTTEIDGETIVQICPYQTALEAG